MRKLVNSKRGVSEVVGYVLLVVIAIGLSVGVYSYLKVFVPKEKPECQEDIHLIVQDYSYHFTSSPLKADLTITLSNKGLFNISSAYVRLGTVGRTVRYPIGLDRGKVDFDAGLSPGASRSFIFEDLQAADISQSLINNLVGEMMLEIQPVVLSDKGTEVLCPNAIITQKITSTPVA